MPILFVLGFGDERIHTGSREVFSNFGAGVE